MTSGLEWEQAADARLDGLVVYQVGGSVRDRLLGLPAGDRDFVVVGSTPEELLRRGFRPVGREFPVFLHPDSGDEFALARTERKHGRGYRGFVFRTGPEVTLEEDLARRDLTINAMAAAPDGRLIDPFHGCVDLRAGRLRHVSDAFREDPVRILRLARFATRFDDFAIADATLDLCRQMVRDGETEHLVAERVWQEMSRALMHERPARFIEVLRETGGLAVVLPEVDALFGIPQPARHHPEIDTGRHVLLVLDQAAALGGDLPVRFAALVHDLGKALSPPDLLPAHHGHERRGLALIRKLCERLRVPNACRELALLVGELHLKVHQVEQMRPGKVLQLLERIDVFRRPQRLAPFLLACQADYTGRLGREARAYPQADLLVRAAAAAGEINGGRLAAQGLEGPAIARALQQQRIQRIQRELQSGSEPNQR